MQLSSNKENFFFAAEDDIRDFHVTGVQACALPISAPADGHSPARTHCPHAGFFAVQTRRPCRIMVRVSGPRSAGSKSAATSFSSFATSACALHQIGRAHV